MGAGPEKLEPTTLGRVINELMLEQFPNIVDVKFSAHNGGRSWTPLETARRTGTRSSTILHDFDKTLKEARSKDGGQKDQGARMRRQTRSVSCTGRKMVIKAGRYGKFLGLPGLPRIQNAPSA